MSTTDPIEPVTETPAAATEVAEEPAAATSHSQRVRDAIARTARVLPEHWERLLLSRTPGPSACGSVCDVPETGLAAAVAHATWVPYHHPEILAGCSAFWTSDILGTMGIVPINSLHAETEITFRDSHATGFVEACVVGVRGARADGVVIILGDDGKGGEIVYTFHPGAPIAPSRVLATSAAASRTIKPGEAHALALAWAKIVEK